MKKTVKEFELVMRWILLILICAGCVLVVLPFLPMLLWAVVLNFSAWPVYRWLLKRCGQRRTLAAFLTTLGIAFVFLAPFLIVGLSLKSSIHDFLGAVRGVLAAGLPAPPDWLADVPLVGARLSAYLASIAGDQHWLQTKAQNMLDSGSAWFLSGGLRLTLGLIELSGSILIAFFFFRNGADLISRLQRAVERIVGDKGWPLLVLAGNTVNSVVYGILGTALAQGVVAAIGFAIARMPGAVLLGLMTFVASVLFVGPPLIWIPATLWLFSQGRTKAALFVLVWGLGVSTMDNFIKPWLISRGSNMPFVLILLGIIGGVLAFGFIGVFLGPVLLAVAYNLLREWMSEAAGDL